MTEISAAGWLNDVAGMVWKPDPVGAPSVQVRIMDLPEVAAMHAALVAVLDKHQPLEEDPYSLVPAGQTCSCGMLEVRITEDGERWMVPVAYPCPIVRTITETLTGWRDR